MLKKKVQKTKGNCKHIWAERNFHLSLEQLHYSFQLYSDVEAREVKLNQPSPTFSFQCQLYFNLLTWQILSLLLFKLQLQVCKWSLKLIAAAKDSWSCFLFQVSGRGYCNYEQYNSKRFPFSFFCSYLQCKCGLCILRRNFGNC